MVAVAWSDDPSVRDDIAADPTLWGTSTGFDDRLRSRLDGWIEGITTGIAATGRPKRELARGASIGVNALGTGVMLATFVHTGGLTGAEVGVAAATAFLNHKLLAALFGEAAMVELIDSARRRLDAALTQTFEEERRRFERLVTPAGQLAELASDLRAAVADLRALPAGTLIGDLNRPRWTGRAAALAQSLRRRCGRRRGPWPAHGTGSGRPRGSTRSSRLSLRCLRAGARWRYGGRQIQPPECPRGVASESRLGPPPDDGPPCRVGPARGTRRPDWPAGLAGGDRRARARRGALGFGRDPGPTGHGFGGHRTQRGGRAGATQGRRRGVDHRPGEVPRHSPVRRFPTTVADEAGSAGDRGQQGGPAERGRRRAGTSRPGGGCPPWVGGPQWAR